MKLFLIKFDDSSFLVESDCLGNVEELVYRELVQSDEIDPFIVEEIIFEEGIYEL